LTQDCLQLLKIPVIVYGLLLAIFPVVLAMFSVCVLEMAYLSRVLMGPSRTYDCRKWYKPSFVGLLVFVILLLFGIPLKYVDLYFADVILGFVGLLSAPLALSLVAVSIWQPLWTTRDTRFFLILRLLPALLLFAALLGPVAAFLLVPFGLVVILLEFISLVGIMVASAVARSTPEGGSATLTSAECDPQQSPV
jgi:hypothetical protein